jgi:UDP-N-acetylmuramate--alanine ligase
MYHKDLHIHFLGIGGIGMSGIAKILKYQGYRISGCDLDLNQQTVQELINIGCNIANWHNSSLCQDQSIDILVYSSAVSINNIEVQAARLRGIPTIPRALMLAELMRTKHGIAIAGAHGKTTTTSMVSQVLIEAGMNPTVIIGGRLKSISTNAQLGGGDFLVAEADESDKSLLHLQATLAVITNIDLEHLETYKNLDEIKQIFIGFLNNLPFYGKAILCIDCPNIRSLFPMPQIKTIKYGIDCTQSNNPELFADIYATNIELEPMHSVFTVWQNQKKLGVININIPGKHNVLNSLGAIAVGLDLNIPFKSIASALKNFRGVERRFSYHGTTLQGAEIFDDYGHHPAEIEQTLLVAKRRTQKKLCVVFQPHRFSRTQKLWDSFVDLFCTNQTDHLIITDIYPASEQPITGITSEALVAAIKAKQPNIKVSYVPITQDFAQIIREINQFSNQKDLLLLLGAGKINQIAKKIAV